MRIRAALPVLVATLAGCGGSDDVTGPGPTPPTAPVLEYFLVTSPTLSHGDWAQLRWRVTGASVASITPDVGVLANPSDGAISIRPYRTTTYTLTVSNDHGTITATADVVVTYPAGVYVDSVHGDDAGGGDSPAHAVKTLGEALARTAGGGAIFLSAGVYADPVVIDGPERTVYGALDPTTFFEDPGTFETWVRPPGATIPLTVRNSPIGTTLLSNMKFDARNGGEVAADVQDARVILVGCTFDARLSASGTAVRARGASDLQLLRCRVFAGRKAPAHDATCALSVADASAATVNASFLDGGSALSSPTGVDVSTTGSVRLGFNTIGVQMATTTTSNPGACVRIRAGHPSLGGNVLFTRGAAERHAVVEEAADADPSWLLGNLFVSAGTPPYDNWADDGPDPLTEDELNTAVFINGDGSSLYGNRLVTGISVGDLFRNVDQGDFHLVSPMISGDANPAVDAGNAIFLNPVLFGELGVDVDGQVRPGSAALYDLGADER